MLMVVGITQDEVSVEDTTKLDELGFYWSSEFDCWASSYFGSA